MSAVQRAARAYLAVGLSVIPVRKKVPAESGWRQFAARHASADEVRAWWGARSSYGVGIACGPASGNLAVLDFERWDAYERWLLKLTPELAVWAGKCPLAHTGGGGAHLYARLPEPVPGTVLAREASTDANDFSGSNLKTKTLIEVRGNGHQVVAPGSPASTHKSGKPYLWLREGWASGGAASVEVPLDVWLSWCFAAEELNEVPREEPKPMPRPSAPVRNPGDVRPGDDFNRRGTWGETGLLDVWAWDRQLEFDRGFVRRPGKDKGDGLSGSVGMVTCREKGYPLFHCFTSNGAPFEAGNSYSRYSVFGWLKHRGDWKAATRALGAAGYGTQAKRPKAKG